VKGRDLSDYKENRMLRRAVERELSIVGEATTSTLEPSKPLRTERSILSTCLPSCWTIWSAPSPRP